MLGDCFDDVLGCEKYKIFAAMDATYGVLFVYGFLSGHLALHRIVDIILEIYATYIPQCAIATRDS